MRKATQDFPDRQVGGSPVPGGGSHHGGGGQQSLAPQHPRQDQAERDGRGRRDRAADHQASRTVIDQAIGVIMAPQCCGSEGAFMILRTA
ncbi:hypothetical protein ACFWU3_06005 [Streptomyces sp. NPDC058685]|uniref:hypothetical protein n=1 Tax=Streptomyces sp. NPDC058685 TaxID=3346598 RepID=UPI003648DA18